MSEGLKIALVAGFLILASAYVLAGRYGPVSNPNAVGVYDRFTGQVYPFGTTYKAPP